MGRPISLNVDDLFEWWDDAIAMAEARSWLYNRKQRVFAANGLWAVTEA